MEIAGQFDFNSNGISVAGEDGQNGVSNGSATPHMQVVVEEGGGGYAYITYNVAGTITGTIKSSGGVGGNALINGSVNRFWWLWAGSLTNAGSNGNTTTTNGSKMVVTVENWHVFNGLNIAYS